MPATSISKAAIKKVCTEYQEAREMSNSGNGASTPTSTLIYSTNLTFTTSTLSAPCSRTGFAISLTRFCQRPSRLASLLNARVPLQPHNYSKTSFRNSHPLTTTSFSPLPAILLYYTLAPKRTKWTTEISASASSLV